MEIIPEFVVVGLWGFVVFGFIYTGAQALRQRSVWIPNNLLGGRVMRGKAARVYGMILLTIGLCLLAISVWAFFRIWAAVQR